MRRKFLLLCLLFTAGAGAQQASDPRGTITLDDAVRLAMSRSPLLASAGLEVDARSERARQLSRLPNPSLVATVENAGSDAISRETTAGVQQLLELGGDRAARTSVARRGRDIAAQEYTSVRAVIAGEVRRAFTSTLAAQQEVAIARENVELAQNTAAGIRARVEAGKTSPIEETRSDVLVAAERLELLRAERRLDEARRRLAATWGAGQPDFDSVAGDLEAIAQPPTLEALRSRVENHPSVIRAVAVIAEREAIVRLEEARAIPDVTASAGYRRFSSPNDRAFIGGVTVPLPLFDRNRAAIAEARLRVAQAQQDARAIRVGIERDLANAYRAYETARQEVLTLQNDIVPAAQSVFDAISEGYRLGKFGYLEVLDARRTLTSARLQLARALEQLQLAITSVEQLSAQPAPSLEGDVN